MTSASFAERVSVEGLVALLAQWEDQSTGGLHRFARLAKQAMLHSPPTTVVCAARELERTAGNAGHLVACELLDDKRIRPALTEDDVSALGTNLDSWVAVDVFAVYVLGPAWREGQVRDRYVREWARSADRWRRRAALAATVALNCKARGGRGDVTRTLAICRLLVADRDDMVVKAMSWALREASRRDAQAVVDFLAEHEHTLASRVRREVTTKLTTGTKSGRRAGQ